MRGIRLALLASITLLLPLAQSAGAESQTVQGAGDIDKMYVKNAQNELTVKLFGFGAPCSEARDFTIRVRWGDPAAYEVQAVCTAGTTWYETLYYLPDGDPQDPRKVDCPGLRVTYNSAGGFHRAIVPRSCIHRAANRVKVSSHGSNYGSTTGGTAGPTRSLRRG